jgi:hypothetical protein
VTPYHALTLADLVQEDGRFETITTLRAPRNSCGDLKPKHRTCSVPTPRPFSGTSGHGNVSDNVQIDLAVFVWTEDGIKGVRGGAGAKRGVRQDRDVVGRRIEWNLISKKRDPDYRRWASWNYQKVDRTLEKIAQVRSTTEEAVLVEHPKMGRAEFGPVGWCGVSTLAAF